MSGLPRCESCGSPLAGYRSDATTCSNACRQKAYRARIRNARWFDSPEEAADAAIMGQLDEVRFDAVLAECRAEGDLSRENVVRHCVTALSVTQEDDET
jgi:hypothetical protein